MNADALKSGDKARIKWPGYWANGKIVEVAEGSREYGIPIRHPDVADVLVVGPEVLHPVGA